MDRMSNTSSLETTSILVVDDDTTCLSIVAAILKKWKYEVVTVKHPIDALCTLRIRRGSFDLVVLDVHMPYMNGFELKQVIDEEFKLPVVLMSADDKEGIILKGLESGAAYFIVKPILPDDFKNLWQFTNSKKKNRYFLHEKNDYLQENLSVFNHDFESESSTNKYRRSKKESKRKSIKKFNNNYNEDEELDENVDNFTPKKAKVVWTNTLHNRFLEAIRIVGLERAVPKKILELMKVPGLTRENVASHLQKYRIFLKRVSDASYRLQSASENSSIEKNIRSSTVYKNHSSILNKFAQDHSFFKPGSSLLLSNKLSFGLNTYQISEANDLSGANGFINGGEKQQPISDFENGGFDDFSFGLLNNNSNIWFENFSVMQEPPYEQRGGDLSDIFLNQANIQSPIQEHGEEAPMGSNLINLCSNENQISGYFPWNNQNQNQQILGYSMGSEDFGINQFNNTLMGTNQSHLERDDEEFLESVIGHGPYGGDNSPGGF